VKSLADAVGASGLSGYAIVALVLFVFAFVLILIPLMAPSRDAEYEADGRMPLDDLTPIPGRTPAPPTPRPQQHA
jgi:uncharacterized membrane protein YtjA (UPF0391 family)